ncbi:MULTISPECIES: hypothetical protein [unclassified Tolypothrix]|uniref:hypothetical protein n=1 Tax=unclassified Tolypothrix TaxID=2649714 RepID=UPI0005EAA914|nr:MULTISPECIES: hypothetical protein [unclassified Tolypothrix]BAY92742.1 hypothetical protein NIES3275_47790 [Microchaete diplosiphon NIES-3275]EKF05849.1 hypothetical protein FDUTEX481_00710 [Tolypothrix sp. PCC 7601]MBE9081496.1 hypothetical protein [Tolypothrix sp. LEGE 11397]UYD26665.1 hypothetical protein HGR01_00635 [Tolypothrix sp. PCC 7712]UYD37476.1 hypothetical protein HG267_18175 [Tolypothrix sp. PCC 7601]
MNNIWSQRFSALLICSTVTIFGSELSAQVQTPPTPGKTSTTAADLIPQPTQPAAETAAEVAQVDINPGRTTRGGSSYIGVAGNIGLGGDSALSEGGFMVISKIGLTRSISVRPSVAIEDDPVVLVPLTYDFNFRTADAFEDTFSVAPYVGAGVAIETSDDPDVGLLLTGGVDVPLNTNFTATAGVNAAFLDDTDVGLMLGVGYNFTGF